MCCDNSYVSNGSLSKADVQNISLVGGSLISNMDNHPYFETYLVRYFQTPDFSLRNIGWPADDVFGLARSQFGSAQNTQSWKPPSAEEGFGSKVLFEHIKKTNPKTLLIGYGAEAAFYRDEEEMKLFQSGYVRLLDFADSLVNKVILLSPPMHEKKDPLDESYREKNEQLAKVTSFIKGEAESRGYDFIDLNSALITDSSSRKFTTNGVQLSDEGYQRMTEIMVDHLGLELESEFGLSLDENSKATESQNASISDWKSTLRGASFKLKPNAGVYKGKITSETPIAIYVDGELCTKSMDTFSTLVIPNELALHERLVSTIQEKNRLFNYQIRPLNEAYIYLFRKHEMGHLAYEMDELAELVKEKETEIHGLIKSEAHDIEIEQIKPWVAPRKYPDDEVPNFIPEPNVEEELAAFKLSDEIEISLFAKDPMIANPININWDLEGRAWIATSSTYPHIVPGREPNDKIIILEDTDGDGQADKHTVFAENLLVPHSVMPVKGGAYVTSTTEFLFLEDTDGDDVADKRHVIFSGFGNADIHHTIHGLQWMPWGDLHFIQSIYINSFIDTPNGPRILNGSGVWKFRPETQDLEIYSRGLVNPWGETLNEWGEIFATDGAGGNGLAYMFPGSAHRSAVGTSKILNELNSSKPKYTAAQIINNDHFPSEWKGSLITSDFRANRTVRYELGPDKSGFKAEEVQTILSSEHRAFRPVDSKIGPDGALYIVDWYNPIIDHGEVDFHHPVRDKTHGRIWKVKNKKKDLFPTVNFKKLSIDELFGHLKSTKQFDRGQAIRALVENEVDPQVVVDWISNLRNGEANYSRNRVHGLWLLASLNHYDPKVLRSFLDSSNKNERVVGLRMLSHFGKEKDFVEKLNALIQDSQPAVRLSAILSIQHLGTYESVEMLMKTLDAPMDENIDYALSMALENLKDVWLEQWKSNENIFDGNIEKQMFALLSVEDQRTVPILSELLENKITDKKLEGRAWNLLAKIGDGPTKEMILEKAIADQESKYLRTMVYAPGSYDAVPEDLGLLEQVIKHDSLYMRLEGLRLAKRWKAAELSDEIKRIANETTFDNERLESFRTLYALDNESFVIEKAQGSDTLSIIEATTAWIEQDAEASKNHAIGLLSKIENQDEAKAIYNAFRNQDGGALILEEALKGITIPEGIASAGLEILQASGINYGSLEAQLRESGLISSVGMELTQEEKEELIKDALASGNSNRGRNIYRSKDLLCATCHQVNNVGGLSGPPLGSIGAFMTPNAILDAVINPNGDIKQNYETIVITKTDGEIVSGILNRKTNQSVLLRQANSKVIEIPNDEIQKTDVSEYSLMPIGLTRNLSRDELKDLLAYLVKLKGE
ncbi:hypothetical protein GCM10007940_32940 [Portibacter lacus]|uniref:Cytochrome c domain-containing protein n=1 Tax=Portibacter lacus TaxID=1099794 RepID=A0AA37SV45_9BACT|nr:hypothetical protein GCM10007940_32940 [Portibacter lacus]